MIYHNDFFLQQVHWWCRLSHPVLDVFVWRFCSIPEELRNNTTKYILSSAGEPYGILVDKSPKLFIVNLVQQKRSCYIGKCIIRNLDFTIDRRWISTFSLNYDVNAMTYLCEFRIFFQCSIFIKLGECNFLILIPQCSEFFL